MNIEDSRITLVNSARRPDQPVLRQALFNFGSVVKLEDALVLEKAQQIVDLSRKEFNELIAKGELDSDKVRYLKEVLKTIDLASEGRLEVPDYEALAASSEDCRVTLKDEASNTVFDRESSAG